MEVVALVSNRDHVSARYRLLQFRNHLASKGLQLSIEPLVTGRRRIAQLGKRRRVAILQRKLLPVSQLAILRQSTRQLVYDFDDAVFLRDSFHVRGLYSFTRWARFHAAVALADQVFAGNAYLAEAAGKCTSRRKISVIPTCLDVDRYSAARHEAGDPFRLVWIGSKSTLKSLEHSRNLLEHIGENVPDAVLRVICNRFPRFERLAVEASLWSREREPADLVDGDVGVSLMPDDPWSRGKCGLKVLQYMASGLPVVASPVGVHHELVSREVGFLARDASEWVRRVRELGDSPGLRAEMGAEGRRRVARDFNVATWGPLVAETLSRTAAKA